MTVPAPAGGNTTPPSAAATTVFLAVDGMTCGACAARVQRVLGLRSVLVTDHPYTAQAVADAVGITEVVADTLPEGKQAHVHRLRSEGHRVAVVGDGVNDAPALARADLGLAVVTGTYGAQGAADIILVRDDLLLVAAAIQEKITCPVSARVASCG
jgi:P-type E1-E2 ATPase